MSTDRGILARSIEEPEAFGELFDRHARTLHRFVAARADEHVADDVIAETFLRAFERRDRFDQQREDALPWLFGIAVNVLRHRRRADLRFVHEVPDLAEDHDSYGALGSRIDAERRLRTVLAAIHRIPAANRDVVLLHVWGGLTYEQIAEALGVPVGTVRSRFNRARAKLRVLTDPSDLSDRPNGESYGHDTAAAQLP